MLKSRLMSLLVNRPLLALPSVAMTIQSVLAQWDGSEAMLSQWVKPDANRFAGEFSVSKDRRKFFYKMSDVAICTVDGELVNRGAWIGADSGLVSYEGIVAQISEAAADPEIAAIILDMNSPGGEAIGAMETADAIRSIAKTKPVYAWVNGMACSAGYALISGCTKIFAGKTSVLGSIGVVMLHMDHSGEMKEAGIVPTLIHAGAHKVDANPFEPLSDKVKSDLQSEVMKFYGLFVSTVAAGRPGLSPEAIRATEARTYIGQEAVDVGLADEITTFDAMVASIKGANGRSTVSKGVSMTDKKGDPAASSADNTADAVQAAVAAATTRMTTVMGHADVAGNAQRMAAATELLATTSMTAEQVVSFVTKNVAAAASIPTIEQRASGVEVPAPTARPHQGADASWKTAVARVNSHSTMN